VAAVRDLEEVLTHLHEVRPALLVLDSVQTVSVPGLDGAAGGPSQVRAVTGALVDAAKRAGTTVVLVGHVTKDGAIAGPRVLEHLVDVVLLFEGDRHSRLRLLRGVKNRFGPADEVGCLDLTEGGIRSVPDPATLFLSANPEAVPGRCWTVTLEGRRALPVEVQALVGPPGAGQGTAAPKRLATGLAPARLTLLLAVLEQRCRLPLRGCDVYTATVGGLSIAEPAGDLAAALAVASAATELALPAGVTAVGEVGLDGEIRPVGGLRVRVTEAARVGARRVLVPASARGSSAELPAPDGCDVIPVRSLTEALHRAHGSASLRLVRPVRS
jgi:DNA repair protein RadA/Sms